MAIPIVVGKQFVALSHYSGIGLLCGIEIADVVKLFVVMDAATPLPVAEEINSANARRRACSPAVLLVLLLSHWPQMLRTNTERVVALVVYLHAHRYWANEQFVRSTIR